jgi:hypothetical protein
MMEGHSIIFVATVQSYMVEYIDALSFLVATLFAGNKLLTAVDHM